MRYKKYLSIYNFFKGLFSTIFDVHSTFIQVICFSSTNQEKKMFNRMYQKGVTIIIIIISIIVVVVIVVNFITSSSSFTCSSPPHVLTVLSTSSDKTFQRLKETKSSSSKVEAKRLDGWMEGRCERVFFGRGKKKKQSMLDVIFRCSLVAVREKSILKRKMSFGMRGEEKEVEVCIVCCV